jgi:hypothetical protein
MAGEGLSRKLNPAATYAPGASAELEIRPAELICALSTRRPPSLMRPLATLLDRLPWSIVIIACLTLGLAPFVPEPHVWEKLKMLAGGTLAKPIDVFDLVMHAAPFIAAALKLVVPAVKE